MAQRSILIIDDEPVNVEILEKFLQMGENADHNYIKCYNGVEGFEALIEYQDRIDVILLDRMMPVMSGVDFLIKLNDYPELKKIPVIMQTASNLKEHMLEGFQLGVYHYLVKPYSPILLNSIVRSAIEFYSRQRELSIDLSNTKNLFKYVVKAIFKIKSLEDVDLISVSLAKLFPQPDRVVLGISEILINAIEHGNLAITYNEKSELNLHCKWREEVEKRLKMPEYSNKSVLVSFLNQGDEIVLNVKDEGNGFDFEKYRDFDPSRSTDNHGRGIAFANKLSFDRVEYIGCGNEVNCSVTVTPNPENLLKPVLNKIESCRKAI